MTVSCEEVTLRKIHTYWEEEDGKLEPPSIVRNSICPNDCSGNGECINSSCVCYTGFKSSDCSMKEGIHNLSRLLYIIYLME